MITTKTQFKPKHTYLHTYIPTYFYLIYPVIPVKNNNSSYPSVPSVAKNMFLQNKANLQKAGSPLAIDTTMEDGIVICRCRPEIFGQTLPVLPIYQDCFGCRSCSAFTRHTKKLNEANLGLRKTD